MKYILLVLFASALCAQTVVTPKPLPDFFVAVGGGFSPSTSISTAPTNKEYWISGAVRVTDRCYSITTVDLLPTINMLRTGAACQVAKSGNLSLALRIDGGLAFGAVTVGSFAGGPLLSYDLGGVSKALTGWSLVGEARLTGNPAGPTGSVSIGFYAGVTKSFYKNQQ